MFKSGIWRVGAIATAIFCVAFGDACAIDSRQLEVARDAALDGPRDAGDARGPSRDEHDGSVDARDASLGGRDASVATSDAGDAGAALDSDGASVRVDAAGSDGAVIGRDAGCGVGSKWCGDQCVRADDPVYGCGLTTCDRTSCPAAGEGTLVCSGGVCVIGTCGPGTKKCGSNCVPTDRNNGCGDPARCTACAASETCAGTPAVCRCVPNDDACTATGKNCGSVIDNCGAMVSCGTCAGLQTCGGGGVANKCGCTPTNPCAGGACGTGLSDGCGGAVNCACAGASTCGGGGVPNVCGTPALAAQGRPCATSAACANGRCVDGVCCASASCGTCMKCNLNGLGTCSDVAAGTADAACPASAASCMAGGCSGSGGTCRPAPLGTSCGQTCTNGTEWFGAGQFTDPATTARVCNGTGAGAAGCVDATNGRALCDGGAICADATNCRSPATCSRHAECAFGWHCAGGSCVLNKADEVPCGSPFECNSKVCTGTRSSNRVPVCAECQTPYDCPHDRPYCTSSNDCYPCDGFSAECSTPAERAHANGTISCSTASCPANATDCSPVTDECHCGALTQCEPGQICVNSLCKVAPLWPCVSNDCAYGTCTSGVCPQAQRGNFCTRLTYPIAECAVGSCGAVLVAPPGSRSFGTPACGP